MCGGFPQDVHNIHTHGDVDAAMAMLMAMLMLAVVMENAMMAIMLRLWWSADDGDKACAQRKSPFFDIGRGGGRDGDADRSVYGKRSW